MPYQSLDIEKLPDHRFGDCRVWNPRHGTMLLCGARSLQLYESYDGTILVDHEGKYFISLSLCEYTLRKL